MMIPYRPCWEFSRNSRTEIIEGECIDGHKASLITLTNNFARIVLRRVASRARSFRLPLTFRRLPPVDRRRRDESLGNSLHPYSSACRPVLHIRHPPRWLNLQRVFDSVRSHMCGITAKGVQPPTEIPFLQPFPPSIPALHTISLAVNFPYLLFLTHPLLFSQLYGSWGAPWDRVGAGMPNGRNA